MEDRIIALEENQKKLEEKLNEVLEILNKIETNCSKMGAHIDFVEGVYDKVRNPLQFLSDRFNGGKKQELPLNSNSGEGSETHQ